MVFLQNEQVLLIVCAILIAAAIFLRRFVRVELLRLSRNRFRPFLGVLFLDRRTVLLIILLQIVDVLRVAAGTMLSSSSTNSTNLLHNSLTYLATGMDPSIVFPIFLVAFSILPMRGHHRLIRRGLLHELALTDVALQSLFLPLFWFCLGIFGVFAALKGALAGHSSPELSICFAARQLAVVWMWTAYLFCAANHGLGWLKIAAGSVLLFVICTVLLGPLQLMAPSMPDFATVALAGQTLGYAALGQVFYVSFLRTGAEFWYRRIGLDVNDEHPSTSIAW